MCTLLLLLTTVVWAQNLPGTAPESRYVKAYRFSTLQKNLNEVAGEGYRLARAKTGPALGEVVDFWLGASAAGAGGVIARMERTQGKYEYAVVLKPIKASNWEKDINLRAEEGFRVIPRFTIPVLRGVVIGTLDELITVMERGPELRRTQYIALQTHSVDGFAPAVQKKLDLGGSLVWMGSWGEWQVALLELDQRKIEEEHVMLSGNYKKLFDEIERRGRDGARLRYYLDGLGLLRNGAAAYLVKTAGQIEYKMLPNKKGSREAFNQAVSLGFRVASGLCANQSLILERSKDDGPVEYVFEESPDQQMKLNASGYALICHGALLGYRDVAILQKP